MSGELGVRVKNELHTIQDEDQLVAELELLGIHYLSRLTCYQASEVRAPDTLLADMVQQPSARVRQAVIAVLLMHPDYAQAVPDALQQLPPPAQLTLHLLYTAATLLQRKCADQLRPLLARRWQWQWLPDLFSAEIDLPSSGSVDQKLVALGQRHRHLTGAVVNWTGTYQNVVQHLVPSRELRSP